MSTESLIDNGVCAVRVCLFGRVQGMGVRPAIARLATQRGISGYVTNTSDGVTLELEGAVQATRQFCTMLADSLPRGAVVDRMEVIPCEVRQRTEFAILERSDDGVNSAPVPLDRVVCATCLDEVGDVRNHRYGYPLTGCATCGPRYTVVESMPYDRPATTMRHFAMCPTCSEEYRTVDDRRFHAQTNSCAQCGPRIYSLDEEGRGVQGSNAIELAGRALQSGRIVALKGLGGYQLLVDATSAESVRRLRVRKQRISKPLALLVGSLAEAEQLAMLTDVERKLLTDPAGPIVLVRRRGESWLASDVAPGFGSVGIMLPTTPLHAQLCRVVARPLICTSGNREGDPLVYEELVAHRELSGIADLWLHHNRPIERPIDDSVVRVIAGEACLMRMGRGYAPHVLPLHLGQPESQIVAVGGDQKAAVAIWNGSQAVLAPHIGDLTGAGACERWGEQLQGLCKLYGIQLDSALVVHDRHPDYFTTGWSQQFRMRHSAQHHHAHLASVMLEHGFTDGEALGLSWDGTGYGDDGTIWGGECLRLSYHRYQRVAWLRPFPLLGGEQAVREPWRIAVALVRDAIGATAASMLSWPHLDSGKIPALMELAARPRLFALTSSMGRLFDAVAALVLGIATSDHEGSAAMLLEEACDWLAGGTYHMPWDRKTGEIDWRPLIVELVEDLQRGAGPGVVAMRFHRAIAELAYSLAMSHADLPLVTSGGVFQNAILGELLAERMMTRRAGWFRATTIPPGDGGLAAGQLAIAAAQLDLVRGRKCRCV